MTKEGTIFYLMSSMITYLYQNDMLLKVILSFEMLYSYEKFIPSYATMHEVRDRSTTRRVSLTQWS